MVRLTAAAQAALNDDEVLVFAWHRVPICCAIAGEVSIQAMPRRIVQRHPDRYRPLPSEPPGRVHAARAALPHLLGRPVTVDGGRRFGMRRFVSDLPADFGLRAVLGRSPDAH
jgi:hypothetical protein